MKHFTKTLTNKILNLLSNIFQKEPSQQVCAKMQGVIWQILKISPKIYFKYAKKNVTNLRDLENLQGQNLSARAASQQSILPFQLLWLSGDFLGSVQRTIFL